jgi:glycosyltransferase involved in cell wall biosynthesis
MEKSVDASIILCAYNEGDIIEKTIHRVDCVMKKTGLNYEIIVVDDGSLDDTKDKVINYKYKNGERHVKVVSYRKNVGKGNAVKVGFELAKGEFIVVMDSDLDVDPKHIPSYIEALKDSDVVVSSKWHPKSRASITLSRKALSLGFNVLSKLFVGIKLRDTQTGLKAFRRSVLERMMPKLVIKRYASDLELLAACNHCGFRITVLPVNVRVNGLIGFKEILKMAFDLLKISYRLRILKYYQRP